MVAGSALAAWVGSGFKSPPGWGILEQLLFLSLPRRKGGINQRRSERAVTGREEVQELQCCGYYSCVTGVKTTSKKGMHFQVNTYTVGYIPMPFDPGDG